MAFKYLQLKNFRSYINYRVEFDAGINIIVGPNGSGKTNLLEALYVLSVGGSFRVGDKDLLNYDSSWFKLEAVYGDQKRVLTYKLLPESADKLFVFNDAKRARLTHQHRLPVVLFEPDHLRLLRESPSLRRDYLDGLLTKLQPDFAWLKHQFERVLAQRNAILKHHLPHNQLVDQLFVWDIKFASLADQLVKRRLGLLADINSVVGGTYSQIASKPHSVDVTYQTSIQSADYQAALLGQLQKMVVRDKERGFTSVGPHRDDFTINLNGLPASASASRGEVRSLLLALKVIELDLLAKHHDTAPLLLLDDVFSELDTNRRQALAGLARKYQTFITTTDADVIKKLAVVGKIIKRS